MEKLNFKSIGQRLKAETPKFWKQIRKIMVGCTAIGGALLTVKSKYEIDWLPSQLIQALLVAGALGTVLSSLTANSNGTTTDSSSGDSTGA